MKGIAISYFFIFILGLISFVIVLTLYFYFKSVIEKILEEKKSFSFEAIEIKESFTTEKINALIESCIQKYGNFSNKVVCYVLNGDYSDVWDINSEILGFEVLDNLDRTATVAIIFIDPKEKKVEIIS